MLDLVLKNRSYGGAIIKKLVLNCCFLFPLCSCPPLHVRLPADLQVLIQFLPFSKLTVMEFWALHYQGLSPGVEHCFVQITSVLVAWSLNNVNKSAIALVINFILYSSCLSFWKAAVRLCYNITFCLALTSVALFWITMVKYSTDPCDLSSRTQVPSCYKGVFY